MNTFRAAVITTPAGPESIEIVDVAVRHPEDGQVRVAVAAASINPVDLAVSSGLFHAAGLIAGDAAVGLGMDFAGTVVESGAGVDLAPGTRVAGVLTGFDKPTGAYAEEVVVPVDAVAVVPEPLDLVAASTAAINAVAAEQILDLLGEPRPGSDRLLVTGAAGVLGGYLLVLGRRRGWDVTGLARPADEAFVRGLGAAFLDRAPGGWPAVADAAAMQDDALALVRDGGRFVGVMPGRGPAAERGISVGVVDSHADDRLGWLLELAAAGDLPIRVEGTLPLERVADAQRAAAKPGSRGRWVLTP
ncbi:NADP-dependent oxidoreductase [Gordonia sp. GONU]|uniref:alcohol dehydrogenase catalytic domain-containing protein n=1 Tax=Gordonia sp. GONU TaxID=2972949 RepID=UPI0021ACFB97|nr:zinc-binding dehydrogenase [Gordonia sp. GONU]MCR8899183.1 NADP-dependent oxidoreductase [Gordonia sp. GONU]